MKNVCDEDVWRTINNAKVKIDNETGEIRAGMGGKYTGRRINRLSKAALKEDDAVRAANRPALSEAEEKAAAKAAAIETARAEMEKELANIIPAEKQTWAGNGDEITLIYSIGTPAENVNAEEYYAGENKAYLEEVKKSGEYAARLMYGEEIPAWYRKKVDVDNPRKFEIFKKAHDYTVIRETEKAVLIAGDNHYSDDPRVSLWFPKSVLESMGKEKFEKPPSAEQEYAKKLQSGAVKNFPDWYVLNNFTEPDYRTLFHGHASFSQKKETEKAVLVTVKGVDPVTKKDRTFSTWIPKSIIDSDKYKKKEIKEYEKENESVRERIKENYNKEIERIKNE